MKHSKLKYMKLINSLYDQYFNISNVISSWWSLV